MHRLNLNVAIDKNFTNIKQVLWPSNQSLMQSSLSKKLDPDYSTVQWGAGKQFTQV